MSQQHQQQQLPSSTLLSSSLASSTPMENNKTVINWGIVGLGDVTQQKSGPAFYKAQQSKLVAVMRRTPGKAQEWVEMQQREQEQKRQQKLLKDCKGYDDLQQFLQYPNLNAIYIATPPGGHLEVVRQIVLAAAPELSSSSTSAKSSMSTTSFPLPAVYVEKPVGRCAWETQEMIKLFTNASKKNGGGNVVPFYTAYISRAYERTQALRKLLQEETIGPKVTSISYRLKGQGGARGMQQPGASAGSKSNDDVPALPWRLQASQSGGGLIMDVGCHLIDRIDYLFGPMVNVTGKAMNRNSPWQDVEDYVEMQAEIGEPTTTTMGASGACIPSIGCKVDCIWDFASQEEPLDELVIKGPHGSLEMAAMSPSLPIVVRDQKGNMVRELNFDAPEHTAQEMIQVITDELLVSGNAGGSDWSNDETFDMISRGDNAVRTSKVLDTILSSYYGGRHDEFWLRPETWPGRLKTYQNKVES